MPFFPILIALVIVVSTPMYSENNEVTLFTSSFFLFDGSSSTDSST